MFQFTEFELSLDDLIRKATRKPVIKAISFLLLIPFIGAFIAFLPYQMSFSIDAKTETFTLESSVLPFPSWYLINTNIVDAEGAIRNFSGRLALSSQVNITFEKLKNDSLFIWVEQADENCPNGTCPPVGSLYDQADEKIRDLGQFMEITVPIGAGRSLTLPLAGGLIAGDEGRQQTTPQMPILLEGTIKVLGKSFFADTMFVGGEFSLDAGDRVAAYSEDSQTLAQGYGIARFTNDNTARLVFHVLADEARVSRFGAEGYTLVPSLWSRFKADPFFQAIVIFYTALTPFLIAILAISIRFSRKPRDETNSNE